MKDRFSYGEFFLRVGLAELFFLTPLAFSAWTTTFSIIKNTLAELILLVVGCFWAIRLIERKQEGSLKSSFTLPILALLVSLLISLPRTNNCYLSLLSLARWGSYILVYFLIISSLRERKWINALLFTVLSSAFIAASYSIFQFYGIDFPFWKSSLGGRVFSTFGNPNYLAGHLAACLPLAFIFFCLYDKTKRTISGLVIIVFYTSLLFTSSRGGWFALLMAMIFVLTALSLSMGRGFFKKRRLSLLGLALVILIVTTIYSTPNPLNPRKRNVVQRGLSSVDFQQSSFQQRLLIWLSSMEMIKQSPFWGKGVGTFGLHYPDSQGTVLSREKNRGYIPYANWSINAHNDYLQIWAEIGGVGLGCLIWIVIVFYSKSLSWAKKIRREERFLLIAFMGSTTAILAHSFFSFPFHIIQNGLIFWLMLGLTSLIIKPGKGKEEKHDQERKFSLFLKRGSQIAIILLVIFLGSLIIKIFLADTHVRTAELLLQMKAHAMAARELKEALKLNPHNGQAFSYSGIAYNRLGRYQEALEAIGKARENWIDLSLNNELGYSYLKLGELEKAKEALREKIFFFPNSADAYLILGYLSLLQGEGNLSQGRIYAAKRRLDEAFFYYEQARIFNPNTLPPARLALAYYGVMTKTRQERSSTTKGFSLRPFFSPKNFPLINFLRPLARAHQPIYFKVFLHYPEKAHPPLKGIMEIRENRGKLIKTLVLKEESSFSHNTYLLGGIWEEGAKSGPYLARAKIRCGKYQWVARGNFYIRGEK